MKRLFILLTLLVGLNACAGMNVNVMGVDVKRIKEMKPIEAIGGALVAIGVHELGHIAAMEALDVEYTFTNPISFRFNGELTNSEMGWIYRSGYILQALGGSLLNTIPATRQSDFTIGYNGMSAFQMAIQPFDVGEKMLGGGPSDYTHLDKYEHDAFMEWLGYMAWADLNLYYSIKKND